MSIFAFNAPSIIYFHCELDLPLAEVHFKLIALCVSVHQLSLMVKLIPSPDWFVGVDSINLCEGSQWKQEVTIDLQPYDAGTDSGFTFSSPNFPSSPPENITMVSSCTVHQHAFTC